MCRDDRGRHPFSLVPMLLSASRSSSKINTIHSAAERSVRHVNLERGSAHIHLPLRVKQTGIET